MKKLQKLKLANKCSLQELTIGMQPLGAIDLAAMIGGLNEQLSISGGVLKNVEGGVLFTGSDGSTCLFEHVSWSTDYVLPGKAYQLNGTIHISESWLNDEEYPFTVKRFAHEFGHYLQQQEYGTSSYLWNVAVRSVYSVATDPANHYSEPFEQDATNRGEDYLKDHLKKPNPKK